ncbi:MAG: DUF2461 domain-containing protein [Tidjanibacter sp.]|nr:DUF2461 domain-containing protein [Tidjanibacter sp.]
MFEYSLDFLDRLRVNNNKPWFDAHKGEYLTAKEEFETFAEQLIVGLLEVDGSVAGLTLKECTYRFYRDTRFSPDKSPYKTHFGLFVAPRGKKSGYAGYYFHIEPPKAGYLGGSLLCTGNYRPEPKILKSLREEMLDAGAEFEGAVGRAEGFRLDESGSLRRTPQGFPTNSPYDRYLRLRDFTLMREVDADFFGQPNLVERTVAEYSKTTDFLAIVNRATRYALEEM